MEMGTWRLKGSVGTCCVALSLRGRRGRVIRLHACNYNSPRNAQCVCHCVCVCVGRGWGDWARYFCEYVNPRGEGGERERAAGSSMPEFVAPLRPSAPHCHMQIVFVTWERERQRKWEGEYSVTFREVTTKLCHKMFLRWLLMSRAHTHTHTHTRAHTRAHICTHTACHKMPH